LIWIAGPELEPNWILKMENSVMELNASRKRSVIVKKRRTSISLEDSFWNSLHAIVQMEKVTIGDFIDKIARQRSTPNLSSSLRVAVLEYYRHLAIGNAVVGGPGTARPSQGANDPSGNGDQGPERSTDSWSGLERRRNPFIPTAMAPGTNR
jgi:predicted DNA-binding ribbon-helix-helix protein